MNSRITKAAGLMGLTLVMSAGGLQAQATRTWVSGTGDDINPCSRTAPCATFAGAITKTAAGGEISVLDSGPYGPVTITKSMTIAGSSLAAITVSTGSAITINGASIRVVLRGLTLNGSGAATNGVNFVNGKSLNLEGSAISRFTQSGVNFQPASGGGDLSIQETVLRENGVAGVTVASGSDLFPSVATIVRTQSNRNGIGIWARDNARVTVYDSITSENCSAGLLAASSGLGDADLNVESVISSDNYIGAMADATFPARAFIRVSNLSAAGNTGPGTLARGSGVASSFDNNRVVANGFGTIATQFIVEDGAAQALTILGISPTATVTTSSSAPAVIASPLVTGSGTSRTLTYQPLANQNGDVIITVSSDDSASCGLGPITQFFTISITPVNDAPVTVADSFTGATEITASAPGVLANDLDIDGPGLLAVIQSGPSNGTLTLNVDGSFTYTPSSPLILNDSFNYAASDRRLLGNSVSVSLTITGRRGDANSDGAVTVSDVFYLVNNLFASGAPPLTIFRGDANSDLAVTVADVFFLVNNLFAGGPAPAP